MINSLHKQEKKLPPIYTKTLSISALIMASFVPFSSAASGHWQDGAWLAQIGGGLALSKGLEDDRTLNHSAFALQDRFKNWETDKHSFFWLLGVGYEMPWQQYKIRLGLSYNQMGELENKGVRGPTGDLENYDLNDSYKTSSSMIMADAGFQIPVTNDQKTYVLLNLGFGASRNKFKGFNSTPTADSEATLTVPDNEESQFAWSVGASIAIPLYESMGFEAGYRYVNAGKLKSGQNATYSSPLVDDELAFHLFEARLTWRF